MVNYEKRQKRVKIIKENFLSRLAKYRQATAIIMRIITSDVPLVAVAGNCSLKTDRFAYRLQPNIRKTNSCRRGLPHQANSRQKGTVNFVPKNKMIFFRGLKQDLGYKSGLKIMCRLRYGQFHLFRRQIHQLGQFHYCF